MVSKWGAAVILSAIEQRSQLRLVARAKCLQKNCCLLRWLRRSLLKVVVPIPPLLNFFQPGCGAVLIRDVAHPGR